MATTTVNFDHLAPEGFSLKPFQQVGVAYAAVVGRCIIGDEMGLGKTIQALISLEQANAFPAVIVCPSTLKGNWAKEAQRWLPHRTVEVLQGRNGEADLTADITVVNYDILTDWVASLAQPTGLVVDESHYVKNPKAGRSKAVRDLADSVPADGRVLLLTGTAITNRPEELAHQLWILGGGELLAKIVPGRPIRRSGADGSYTFNDWLGAFRFHFMQMERSEWGTKFFGSRNADILHRGLRRTCYVRRERKNVLGLADTARIPVPLSLNGALAEYRRAAADMERYAAEAAALRAEAEAAAGADVDPNVEARKAAQAHLRAKAITTLTTLRRLAGVAKIDASVEWVNNFLDSNEGRKVIVFAWHDEVQRGLLDAFTKAGHQPAAILAKTKMTADIEAEKERFQTDPNCRVIVCSILAASEGHTLTAASDVLFVEQAWNPGKEQQAEDRANRIGQTRDVSSWKLLAEGTIDERIFDLIESKRKIVNAVLKGEAIDADDESDIVASLLADFGFGAK